MSATAAPTPADEVVQIVSDLHAFIDARMAEHPVFVGMFIYILFRITRLRDNLVRFVARLRAGTKPRPRAPRSEAAIRRSKRRVRNPVQWSRKFGALADLMSREATPFAERLRALLANPEAVAYIKANPGVGRYLRPLCRAFGIPLIPELRLKRKPRPPVGRISEAPSAEATTPAPVTPPPPHPPAPPMRNFWPSEDDPPMAERVARALAARRFFWREI